MKRINPTVILFAALSLIVAVGCGKHKDPLSGGTASVRIHVSDFTITQDEFPDGKAAQNPVNYEGIRAINLAFFNAAGTAVYSEEQLRSDNTTYTTFGEFECELPIGNYTMVVVGRGVSEGDIFVLNSPTEAGYTSERVRETFCATQTVQVNNTDDIDVSATPVRVMAKMNVISTDNRPSDVVRFRTTYSAGSKMFNPTTGFAVGNSGFSLINNPSNTAVGAPIDISSYLFLATDEQTMNVTIECLDANDNVLVTKVVENVPFKRNRVTKLQGNLFSDTQTGTATFQFETDWIEETTVEF